MQIIQVLISFIVMMLLDGLWLTFIAKTHYYAAYSSMMRLEAGTLSPIWPAAFLVYVLLVFGLNYYGLSHAKDSFWQGIWQSALFGWVVYGVYDLTCYSLFKTFPLVMGLVDWAWGGVLFGMTAAITLLILKGLSWSITG
jgi:uncharacterized membrane protein